MKVGKWLLVDTVGAVELKISPIQANIIIDRVD